MAERINITSKAIASVLKNYNEKQAISEYIWNGFDANANTINLVYESNALGLLERLEIRDNGYGINYHRLRQKFDPFFESEKAILIASPKHTSNMHGRSGVGRLTFFTFAQSAQWDTTYLGEEGYHSGTIQINVEQLNSYMYDFTAPPQSEALTGTTVTFTNTRIHKDDFEKIFIPYLTGEFCWFLELNKGKNYNIMINGKALDFSSNIQQREEFQIRYKKSGVLFKIKYIQWSGSLHREQNKFYFLHQGNEVYKDSTELNKPANEHYHSVYIESSFFETYGFRDTYPGSPSIFNSTKSSAEYKFLLKKLNKYISKKQSPILQGNADKLISDYERHGILPIYQTEWENRYRRPELTQTIKVLYQTEPKLFSSLNLNQKKTFVRFLDLILETGERQAIFSILEEVVQLEPAQRAQLADQFQYTKLNRISDTIKLLTDRFNVYYKLKDLVFNENLEANEVHHLQRLIEEHYWIFGEQYHLLTAAEPKFEEALRRYIHLLTEKDEPITIDHPHKQKEMDIFACRQNRLVDRIENIVIELKHPRINIGAQQYYQVSNYIDVILKQPEFNAPNMNWEFHLIGNRFDTSNFIKNQIATNRPHGQQSLVMLLEEGRIKFFVKTWSEVFAEFEIRHTHLDKQLQLERQKLFNKEISADLTVAAVTKNAVSKN